MRIENADPQIPWRKWSGYSGCFVTIEPMKNCEPKSSGFINVAYFAIPISKGLKSYVYARIYDAVK